MQAGEDLRVIEQAKEGPFQRGGVPRGKRHTVDSFLDDLHHASKPADERRDPRREGGAEHQRGAFIPQGWYDQQVMATHDLAYPVVRKRSHQDGDTAQPLDLRADLPQVRIAWIPLAVEVERD